MFSIFKMKIFLIEHSVLIPFVSETSAFKLPHSIIFKVTFSTYVRVTIQETTYFRSSLIMPFI